MDRITVNPKGTPLHVLLEVNEGSTPEHLRAILAPEHDAWLEAHPQWIEGLASRNRRSTVAELRDLLAAHPEWTEAWNEGDWTPLRLAVELHRPDLPEVVNALLDAGANVWTRSNAELTAAHGLAATGRTDGVARETMRVLFEKDASLPLGYPLKDGELIHAVGRSGKSTLHYAAGAAFKRDGWTQRMYNALVESMGADESYRPRYQWRDGRTPAEVLGDRVVAHHG